MNVLETARKLLESVGYLTISMQDADIFSFEDPTLLGFVWNAPSVGIILSSWQEKQDDFLKRRDRELRRAKEKSWNVYSVFLTEEESTKERLLELARIEDDFRGTRKIARSDLRVISQVTRALLPLLPIQNQLSLGEFDATHRLRARLKSINEKMAEVFLQQKLSETAIESILDADENP
jgi:hypothetical protein